MELVFSFRGEKRLSCRVRITREFANEFARIFFRLKTGIELRETDWLYAASMPPEFDRLNKRRAIRDIAEIQFVPYADGTISIELVILNRGKMRWSVPLNMNKINKVLAIAGVRQLANRSDES